MVYALIADHGNSAEHAKTKRKQTNVKINKGSMCACVWMHNKDNHENVTGSVGSGIVEPAASASRLGETVVAGSSCCLRNLNFSCETFWNQTRVKREKLQ